MTRVMTQALSNFRPVLPVELFSTFRLLSFLLAHTRPNVEGCGLLQQPLHHARLRR